MKYVKRISQIMLIVSVLAILGIGLFSLAESPVDICIEENRTAEKVLPFTMESYASGAYQDSLELALGDQLPLAAKIKKGYNSFFESFSAPYIKRVLGTNPDGITYVKLNEYVNLIDDYMMFNTTNIDNCMDGLDKAIENKNALFAAHPEFEYYAYYIEKDNDIDFSSGKRAGVLDYLKVGLNLPEGHFGVFPLKDLEQYKADFFKTDHHWNIFGAHKGYMQLINMILPGEKLINPVDIVEIGTWCGSKALLAGSNQRESVSLYEYDFPESVVGDVVDLVDKDDIDRYEWYIEKARTATEGAAQLSADSYGDVFGVDYGEMIWENPDCENGNILIFGDSFDNAIMKLLSCHFSKIYAVDLRYYELQKNKKFNFETYIKDKDIKYILFVGSESFWYAEEFLVPMESQK